MWTRDKILDELNEISPVVAAVPSVNVFTAPKNYFNEIENELQARIAAEKFSVPQNPFSVPQGYFENLSGNILQKILNKEQTAAEEIIELSPVIAGIGNRNIFTVPEGYFDQKFFTQIKQPAKVVPMGRVRKLVKYAAAAVITGLLGVGIMKMVNYNKISQAPADNVMAAVADGNRIIQNGTFKSELKSVSDSDIEQYLQQHGQDVNAAIIASSITDDAAALPDASEYLLDENTLDDYLKKNNLKN